ncbi:MAG: RNA methyltransferase [Bacteroidetes bacterium]|nr:MAG: RNA methyltransferase [Bacteroidota bacterium]
MRKLAMEELNRKSVDEFRSSQKIPIIVVLDNVRSMHNVGSVFRTADAFLLEGLYLCGYTPKPPHRDIQKTALGATETVSWKYFESTLRAVEELKNAGYEIWAIEQAVGSLDLSGVTMGKAQETGNNGQAYLTNIGAKIALVFGNEVSGVDQAVMNSCSGSIEIPQAGMKHSLNISVAAGIVLWHFFHQYTKLDQSSR